VFASTTLPEHQRTEEHEPIRHHYQIDLFPKARCVRVCMLPKESSNKKKEEEEKHI
jgi:hypothetical protein